MAKKVIGIESIYSSDIVEIPYNNSDPIKIGDEVIFKDNEGKEEFGVIRFFDRESSNESEVWVTSKILRKATPNDVQKVESFTELCQDALEKCNSLIKKYDLDMNVFRVGYSFDGTRAHFMFTSEDRVDFRDLVKELAKIIQKQIHLRQIGPRDKTKFIGGFGKCGRPVCCSTWLGKLESISMDMVRVQSLEGKGSSKLSGTCGKLLCCLKFEIQSYKDLKRDLPKIGTIVKLKKNIVPEDEEVEIIALDILNKKIKVVFEKGKPLVVDIDDIESIVRLPQREKVI